jgi:hypothetical protein
MAMKKKTAPKRSGVDMEAKRAQSERMGKQTASKSQKIDSASYATQRAKNIKTAGQQMRQGVTASGGYAGNRLNVSDVRRSQVQLNAGNAKRNAERLIKERALATRKAANAKKVAKGKK